MGASDIRGGGCLCRQIRYESSAAPIAVAVCHCRDCQKQAGSAFSILAVFPRDAVSIDGELSMFETIGENGNKAERYFCGKCGSPIYSDTESMRSANSIAIKAGTLDDVSGLQPARHYWVRSKQNWVQLRDDVRCLMQQ